MASTNKTPQLGLNQWEPGDDVLRADFNADNVKIEERLNSYPRMIMGSFLGDGVPNRVVNLGFKPKLVIIKGFYNCNSMSVGFLTENDRYIILGGGGVATVNVETKITENGFMLSAEKYFNNSGSNGNPREAYYTAFY